MASLHLEEPMPEKDKSTKLKPFSLKKHNDLVKFVMNNATFNQEITDQLEHLNAEIKWKAGITISQRSQDIVIPEWSEKCKNVVNKFFNRFRRDTYEIQTDIQDTVSHTLDVVKESINSSGADCWLTSNNRILVLVGLKHNHASFVKVVEEFLQNLKEENEKLKEIVKFVSVSSDHVDYLERVQFLNSLKQSHPGIVEATITENRNELCFVGSDEAISSCIQHYDNLKKELKAIQLQLPAEAVKFVSRKEGLEFIDSCLSDDKCVYTLSVESTSSVKVVARSSQECDKVKECLCKNVREATINLPSNNEHIFASKKWYEISKEIDSEKLIDYQINFVKEARHNIKLHGATHLVDKYNRIITDFVSSQTIEKRGLRFSSGISRFMKEKLSKEIEKIESDLREQHVKIEIKVGLGEYQGTAEGILESRRRILALSEEIISKSREYASVGLGTLCFSENGQRNTKGIEAGSNAIIEVTQSSTTETKESSKAEVETIRAEREQEKFRMKLVNQSSSMDPFDQCNFTTNEGLNVSWKYGDIAHEPVSIL